MEISVGKNKGIKVLLNPEGKWKTLLMRDVLMIIIGWAITDHCLLTKPLKPDGDKMNLNVQTEYCDYIAELA